MTARTDDTKSSLQRLLSLDKSFDSFDERVQEAARILGVPLHTQTDAESLPSSTAPLSHTARLDFVLRWLLDKYSTQPEACQCLPSWILLRRILERMPSVALAKSLSAANPLNTCSKALAHLFPSSPVQTNLDNGKQSNKKRKRQSTSIESPSNGQHSALIFDEITASIRLLILRSTPIASATDSASEDRVHALLRLEHADLVNFVKNTLLGLINLQSSQDLPASLVASSMTLIQDLSILQPNAAVDSSDISFCIECLWPAALLLRFLHLQSDSTDVSQQQHVQQSIKALDRFLATHLFVPARVAFLNTQAPKQKKRPQTELPGLVQRLEPLRSEIATLLGAERSDLVKQGRLSSAYGCVPLLLDLAVRCAPIANPKQRIAEAPWIHALFTALSDTITSSNVSSDAVIINQTLNRMLDVLTSKSLVLDADILVNILNQRCNLLPSSGASEQPDFPLVERILSMNSGIFTGVNSDAAKALFHALTAYRGTNSSTVFKSVTTDDWSNPRVVCYKIAVPLMQAYARTRNLPAFFDHWFTCLSDQAYAASSGCILWADSSLEESLRSILETSLTSMQISELLQSRSDALKQSIASSSDANSQIFANTVLLSAIVGAVKTDATIDSLVPHLESLLSVVQSAFVKITDISDLLSLHLLSLCSQIYHLWYPIWSTSHSSEEVQTRNTLLLEGPVTQYALTRLQKSFNKNIDIPAGNVTGVDSAFVFIASICDMQTRLTGHESDYARLFCRAVLPSEAGDKSRGYVSKRPTAFLITLTGFPELLTCIPTSERIKLFQDLFNSFFNESSVSSSVLNEFLDVVFAASDLSTKDDLFTVVCGSIESAGASGLWLQILLQWPLKAFSRQQREKILDIIVSSLSQEKFDGATKQQAMELIVGLLEVPNATAGISTRPATLVEIAGLPLTRVELSAFEDICKCLLRHILDTKEQDRSKSYLEQLSTLVSKFIVKQKDLSLPSAPGRVWLLNALFEVTETRLTEEELSSLPHRSSSTIDSFVKRLWEVLSSSTDDTSSNKDDQEKAQLAVEAFISVPASILQAGGSSTDKYAKRFTKKVHSMLHGTDAIPLPLSIRCFQQLSSDILEHDHLDMCTNAERLLSRDLDAKQYWTITDAFSRMIRAIPEADKVLLIERLLPVSDQRCTSERAVLVRCIISVIQGSRKIVQKEASSSSPETGSVSILVRLLELLNSCSEYEVHQQLVACVISVLRDQPNLVTQYSAEMTIATVTILASPSSPIRSVKQASLVFEGLCAITQSLLQFHRPSLGGRFHLLVPLMQRLLSCLFVPSSKDAGTINRFKHPTWLDQRTASLSLKHAQKYSRLLENLCNPPQINITGHRGKAPELVDETRKVRMHVAQHAPHILHYYCTLTLNGRLGEGMRDALTPGMWAIIDVAEIGADESRGIKALSSSMGNADRAVLRGIWEDWRRFGGAWKG